MRVNKSHDAFNMAIVPHSIVVVTSTTSTQYVLVCGLCTRAGPASRDFCGGPCERRGPYPEATSREVQEGHKADIAQVLWARHTTTHTQCGKRRDAWAAKHRVTHCETRYHIVTHDNTKQARIPDPVCASKDPMWCHNSYCGDGLLLLLAHPHHLCQPASYGTRQECVSKSNHSST